MLHYAKSDTGSYYVETGALIGHEAVDVMAWIEANPNYSGSIFFERWDFEGSIDVTSEFYPETDDDASAEVPAIGRAA